MSAGLTTEHAHVLLCQMAKYTISSIDSKLQIVRSAKTSPSAHFMRLDSRWKSSHLHHMLNASPYSMSCSCHPTNIGTVDEVGLARRVTLLCLENQAQRKGYALKRADASDCVAVGMPVKVL